MGVTDYRRTRQGVIKWNDICIDSTRLLILFSFMLTTYQFHLFFYFLFFVCFVLLFVIRLLVRLPKT